jgi:catechol 2,3-dioxygenase-like lactoylglutathione lyase family enzyme
VGVQLHHVNIRTSDLEATIAFYVEAIGLTVGPRPPFGFPGAWLYDGSSPAVHLILDEKTTTVGNAVDHFAFGFDAIDPVLDRLAKLKLQHSTPQFVPGTEIRQFFLKDPNGVVVELQGP